jgi:hypothetical protein
VLLVAARNQRRDLTPPLLARSNRSLTLRALHQIKKEGLLGGKKIKTGPAANDLVHDIDDKPSLFLQSKRSLCQHYSMGIVIGLSLLIIAVASKERTGISLEQKLTGA